MVSDLKKLGVRLIHCDLANSSSITRFYREFKKVCLAWDILILCPATLKPIGLFDELVFKEWENSVRLNFINQMAIVHNLLSLRRKNSKLGPCVLFFSGGGINDAPTNYSAYILSKIATIKMCELLNAEIPDTRFVSIGPGWVKTKIHQETLKAKSKAGPNYKRTLEKINTDDFVPTERVLDCCDWVVNTSKKVIGGRNINTIHDKWGDKEFEKKLFHDPNLLKLRKYGTIKSD